MTTALTIAGTLCLLLSLGHAVTGRVMLDTLPRNLPATRIGDGAYTRGVIRFTWHALTLMLAATGVLLMAVAHGDRADDYRAVLVVVGTLYASAGVILMWMTRRRPADLLRIPILAPFVVIIVLCWSNL